MPDWLYTILFILLFILCLSVLIVVHELGHFAAAKAFDVYCSEFSIGFGPALLHKKRKKGETYFSIRAIPFGGYVAMLGEGTDEKKNDDEPKKENEPEIDPSRNLLAKRKWKRSIIMVAGVTMNAILALVIFFCSEMFFTQQNFVGINVIEVSENSPATNATDKDGNPAPLAYMDYLDCSSDTRNTNYGIFPTLVNLYDKDGNTLEGNYIAAVKANEVYFKSRKYVDHVYFFGAILESEKYVPNYSDPVDFNADKYKNVSYAIINYRSFINDKETKEKIYTDHYVTCNIVEANDGERKMEDCGISTYLYEHNNTFGEAVGATFVDFGNSAIAVFKGIGSLFTGQGWSSTQGIIGIGFSMSNYLKNYGWRIFLYMWGLISVNLAVFNLLPFPGLDGWHLLVILVEGAFHKEIPNKVKSTISAVGVILLLSFMVLIVIKDIVQIFI